MSIHPDISIHGDTQITRQTKRFDGFECISYTFSSREGETRITIFYPQGSDPPTITDLEDYDDRTI